MATTTVAEIDAQLSQIDALIAYEEQLLELETAEQRVLMENSIYSFIVFRGDDGKLHPSGPHPKQSGFYSDKLPIRMVEGGNRSGKSATGINEDVSYAIGFRPWLEKNHPDYKVDIQVPNKGLIIGIAFKEQVKKVLVPKLLGDPERMLPGALPRSMVKRTRKNSEGVICFVQLTNGSTIDFQAYKQDDDLFESSDYDWIHYDEPPPRPKWVATQRGLTDRRGKCWITMTPLSEPWIFDELVPRTDVGRHTYDIEDNLGYGLTREGIDTFAANLTDDEKEARLRGKYLHLVGLVYKNYHNIHRIPRRDVQFDWNVWFHIDTHPRTPHHCVWIAVLPDDSKYIVGELKNGDPENRIKPFAEAIKTYESTTLGLDTEAIRDIKRLIEPAAKINNPVDGLSIEEAFKRNGIRCKDGSKNRDAGILLLQDELRNCPEEGRYPNLYIFDDLKGVHHELTHYIWDDHEGKGSWSRTEKQKPKDKDDHYIEGIHRILLARPRFVDRIRARQRPDIKPVNNSTGY